MRPAPRVFPRDRAPSVIIAAIFALVSLPACAASGENAVASGQRVVVNDTVVVSFTEPQAHVPFDPRAARLQEATGQMTRIAGHAIELRFDAALLPEWRSSFDDALVEGIANVARDLTDAKKREPHVFEFGAPLVKRVFCKYDAIARESDAVLDARTGEVTITMPAQAPALIPRGAVYSVLVDAFDDYLERKFANATPSTADDDIELYFGYLTESRHARSEKRGDLGTDDGIADDPHSVTIERVADLASRVKPDAAALDARMTKWLLGEASYFARAYAEAPAQTRRAGKNTAFHRAETAYVAWLDSHFEHLTPAQKREVLKTTAVLPYDRDRKPGDGTFVAFAFPGFDWMGHALPVADAWIAAGHPMHDAAPLEEQALYDEVVCPYPQGERGRRTESPRCDRALYEFAFGMDATSQKRFVDWLLEKRDAVMDETAFANVRRLRGENATTREVGLWRAVESDSDAWNAGASVIAEEADAADKRVLVDELAREWKARPDRRGLLLFLFSEIDRYGNGAVDWARFPAQSGAAISKAEFASFIAASPLSISNAHVVWPALGKGWSRAEPIVSRLDAYVDDPLVREHGSQDPERAIHDVVNLLCQEGQVDDLAKLHAYFQSRIAFHAGDAQRFATILGDTREGRCKPPSKTKSKLSGPPTTP